MNALPKSLVNALLQSEELNSHIDNTVNEIKTRVMNELGHPNLSDEIQELVAKYGPLFDVLGREVEEKSQS